MQLNLRDYRKRNGMNQEAFGKLLGLAKAGLHDRKVGMRTSRTFLALV